MTTIQQDALAAGDKAGQGVRGGAWTLLALLFAAYVGGQADRNALSLLSEPLKAAFHLTDVQIGLLQGVSFAITYASAGLVAGYLADRVRRVALIGGGMVVWSLMTIVSGLSMNFRALVAARAGVAVGEASLSPAAYALIADSFPRERHGLAVGQIGRAHV